MNPHSVHCRGVNCFVENNYDRLHLSVVVSCNVNDYGDALVVDWLQLLLTVLSPEL